MDTNTGIVLAPAQRCAADSLLKALPYSSVLALRCEGGMGRTSILREVNAVLGGVFAGAGDFARLLMTRQPAAIEESFLQTVGACLDGGDLVVFDDLNLILDVVDACSYPRSKLLETMLTALLALAETRGKKLIFGLDSNSTPYTLWRRAHWCEVESFTPADYEAICRSYLGPQSAGELDFDGIHRFASALNAYQLNRACIGLRSEQGLNTDSFIGYLREHDMASNVEISEVAPVDLRELKGVDDVVEALETKIVLPFENHQLAAEFGLKPKRGVLLAGPPGTGKTTIGRALAHRLKGKFFLIDGTMVAGSSGFYYKIDKVFERAKNNAPAVIFIDDTDLIFEGDKDHSFCRYLLTMMDGLETASAERVCVMMTTMDVRSLPPAMVRSGRVELWLETRLPDEDARNEILGSRISTLQEPFASANIGVLAQASRGLTGADLKGIVEDGKLLFAHDKAAGEAPRQIEEYFLEAIATLRTNRRNYRKRKPASLIETFKIGFGAEEDAAMTER